MTHRSEPPLPARLTLSIAYGAMLAVAAGIFLTVRWYGERLSPATATATPVSVMAVPPTSNGGFFQLLLALLVVIVAARAAGFVFKLLHQPPVIGEVIAGIALGPSLFGRLAPEAASFLLPASVAPQLSLVAQLGVVLFMFLVGLELDTSQLGRRTHQTVAVSHASIVVPFVLGTILALWLYPRLSPPHVPFTLFASFLGVSLSVTAFPVLARILTDQKLQRTPLGIVALTCAAVDDVTAWCLLAVIVSMSNARASGAAGVVALTLAYLGIMLTLVRPLASRFVRRWDLETTLPKSATAAVLIALLASALATEAIGVHAVFGAFLLGAVIPHDSLVARELTGRLEDLVLVLFLPAFFAVTGLRTEIFLLADASHWVVCLVVIAVASAGKFGGSFVAARLTGLTSRDAASLGILMNTRGLMELVVLNIGLDLGLVSPALFAILVLMAVVTTLATTPILELLRRTEHATPSLARPPRSAGTES
jgi:Kef-type K+ transport system membrane component KefB